MAVRFATFKLTHIFQVLRLAVVQRQRRGRADGLVERHGSVRAGVAARSR
jgi:hypothetical protein